MSPHNLVIPYMTPGFAKLDCIVRTSRFLYPAIKNIYEV